MTEMTWEERRERAAEAKRRFDAGEKAVALADEYGVHIGTIYDWAKERSPARTKVRSQARTGRILRLLALEQNLTAAQVAVKLGIPEGCAAQDLSTMKYRGFLESRPVTYSLAEQGLSALGGM